VLPPPADEEYWNRLSDILQARAPPTSSCAQCETPSAYLLSHVCVCLRAAAAVLLAGAGAGCDWHVRPQNNGPEPAS